VLSQVQDGSEKVIAHAGRSLSRNVINYCVTRKELLAVVHFTRHFRQYLLGRQFIIRTDHAALSWLKKTSEPIGQNARWLELLGEYNYVIRHRQGQSHGNADAISRHPCINKPSCTACHSKATMCAMVTTTEQTPEGGSADEVSSAGPQNDIVESEEAEEPINVVEDGSAYSVGWTRDEMIPAQHADSDVGVIVSLMNKGKKPEWRKVELQSASVKSLWHEWERLGLQDGLLCRKWTPVYGSDVKWQIVLPAVYMDEFMRTVHTGMTGGHLGRSKTEDQVKMRAYWPNWRLQVALELKRCTECAR